MLDPIRVEQGFQNLLHSLRLTSSPRQRLLKIVEFLEPLLRSTNQSYFAAYRRELVPRLCDLLASTDLSCTPAAFLTRADSLLDRMGCVCTEIKDDPHVMNARQQLIRAIQHITEWNDFRIHQEMLPQAEEKRDPEIAADAAWVPLVEREPLVPSQSGQFGALRRLHVEVVFARGTTATDTLHINRRTDLAGLESAAIEEAVSSARLLFEQFAGAPLKRPLQVYCALDDPHLVGGDSLGPSLAMLIFFELLRLSNLRARFAMSPHATLTGRVDSDGTMLPLDEKSLEKKLEACMYSWIRVVALPREQAEAGRAILARLAAESGAPAPPQIVGIANLQEVLLDRRLTRGWRLPVSVHMAHRLWSWRRPLAAALIAGLALVAGWRLFAPMDRTPTDVSFAADEIVVQNRFGEPIERIRVAPGTTGMAHRFDFGSERRYVVLFDAEGDGKTEIAWTDMTAETPGSPSMVYCKTVGVDSLRWTYNLRHSLEFLQNKDVHSDVFGTSYLLARDVDHDGRVDILIAANHEMFFPALLVKLDAQSGKEVSHYVHMGHLNGILLCDLSGDGRDEVITYGTNNAYKLASISVFDGKAIEGSSPATPDYQLASHRPGTELQYVLIPRTAVGEVYADRVPHSGVRWISTVGGDGLIRAHVLDVGYRQGDPDQVVAFVFAYFGRSMQFRGFSTGDDYDLLARQLMTQQILERTPDKAYFDELGKSIRYWNGIGWQSVPR
jgi:hypothetical protein